jgi:IS5 family transposase
LSKREEQEQDLRHALHEPEVDCISKGKARIRCEFGTKVSLATTLDSGFVVGARSFPGNPYDGHTLAPALEQVALLTNHVPALAVVDRGYRGHGVETTKVLISGHKTRHHPAPGKAPPATKRHRAGDRAHEKRRSPGQISAEGPHRRRDLRRPLRLRPQCLEDLRPSQGSLGFVPFPDAGVAPAPKRPVNAKHWPPDTVVQRRPGI